MRSIPSLLTAILALTLPSCVMPAHQGGVTINYLSDPPNATIYKGDTNAQIGRAPASSIYAVTPGSTMVTLPPVTARWVSGATATMPSMEVPVGSAQEFTLIRPKGVPGAEIDAKFASDVMANKIEQEKADILREQGTGSEKSHAVRKIILGF